MKDLDAKTRALIILAVTLSFAVAAVVLRVTKNDAGFFEHNMPILLLFLADTAGVAMKKRDHSTKED